MVPDARRSSSAPHGDEDDFHFKDCLACHAFPHSDFFRLPSEDRRRRELVVLLTPISGLRSKECPILSTQIQARTAQALLAGAGPADVDRPDGFSTSDPAVAAVRL